MPCKTKSWIIEIWTEIMIFLNSKSQGWGEAVLPGSCGAFLNLCRSGGWKSGPHSGMQGSRKRPGKNSNHRQRGCSIFHNLDHFQIFFKKLSKAMTQKPAHYTNIVVYWCCKMQTIYHFNISSFFQMFCYWLRQTSAISFIQRLDL